MSYKKKLRSSHLFQVFRRVLLGIYRIIFKNRIRKQKAFKMEVINNLRIMLQTDPILKLSDFNGFFAIDPRSDLFTRSVLQGNYEPELIRVIKPHINVQRDVIDIGANIGLYTVMLAKLIEKGTVFSIEPTKNALQRLRQNILINAVDNKVKIYEGVVSDRNGIVDLNVIPGREEFSSLGKMNHPSIRDNNREIESVNSITLDSLIERESLDPGFIKIDVEGVEHLVFQGAQKTLRKYRPVILSELCDEMLKKNGSSALEVINLIKANDYDVYDPRNLKEILEPKPYGDILCFPKERKVSFNKE